MFGSAEIDNPKSLKVPAFLTMKVGVKTNNIHTASECESRSWHIILRKLL